MWETCLTLLSFYTQKQIIFLSLRHFRIEIILLLYIGVIFAREKNRKRLNVDKIVRF